MATRCLSTPAGVISHISLDTLRTGSPAQQARLTNRLPSGRYTPSRQ